MQKIKLLLLIFSFFLTAACLTSRPQLLSEAEHARLLEAAGDEWDVDFNTDEIIITSKEKCWFYNGISLPMMTQGEFTAYVKDTGLHDYFRIRVVFVPGWTREQLDKADTNNSGIYDELDALPDKHGIRHLSRTKDASFFPETNEDEKKVAAYEKEYQALEQQLVDLPDMHTKTHSIFLIDNQMGYAMYWENEMPAISFADVFDEVSIK